MTGWFSITPTSPISIGNLTPVGQNSGQVGCRWPPNGHHLAACINLPPDCQLWGPFWHYNSSLYLTLPQPVYTLDTQHQADRPPQNIYRLIWQDEQRLWQVRPEHQKEEIEIVGGRYLINASTLKVFWKIGHLNNNLDNPQIVSFPWKTLTLSHNRRKDYQVVDEGGFFAEMATLMNPGWSIALKIIGNYIPPTWGLLGAGGTPVMIKPLSRQWDWLGGETANPAGAILLTGALWQKNSQKISVPYPNLSIKAYAADIGIPWQSWKRVRDRHDSQRRVQVLTPGEWLTPAGAVYLWDGDINIKNSGPLTDRHNRHVLGYGHLWLFED